MSRGRADWLHVHSFLGNEAKTVAQVENQTHTKAIDHFDNVSIVSDRLPLMYAAI